jgi:ADP-ribose pyrophosphatase YjhB (NUDIX family)
MDDTLNEHRVMQKCDNTSVGLLVWRNHHLLLIERKRPPYGFAPPAGHVDDHVSFEDAAEAELKEEVGLQSRALLLIAGGRKNNKCRRPGGSWHYWKIYEVTAVGDVKASSEETKGICWADALTLRKLASRTRDYLQGKLDQRTWERSHGLEPVWYEWLKELEILPQE